MGMLCKLRDPQRLQGERGQDSWGLCLAREVHQGDLGRSPHTPPAPLLSQQLIYLPPPWGTCKAVTMDLDFFDSYSITACRIDCETRYLVENCNCRMVHMPGQAPELQTQSWGPSACSAPHQLPMHINLLSPWKQDLLASPHPCSSPIPYPYGSVL